MMRAMQAAVAALCLLGLAASGPPPNAAAAPYVLDVIIDLTGSNAYAGATYRDALQVFQRFANQHGGINGRPLELAFHDDESSPQVAVQLATVLMARHPAVLLGPTQTATCAAVAPLTANGPVTFCISPAYSPTPKSYMFAASTSLPNLATAQLRYAHLKGYRRIVRINSTDATGLASDRIYAAVDSLPENRDLQFAPTEHLNPTDISAAAQVARIKAGNPQLIASSSAGPAFGTVLRSLHDAGLDVPFIASAANLDSKLLYQYKDIMPHDLYFNSTLYYGRDRLTPGPQRDAVDAILRSFKSGPEHLTPGSGFAWDPALLLTAVLRKIGPGATAPKVRDYLESLRSFPGVSGTYDFSSGDQHGLNDMAVLYIRWNADTDTFVAVTAPGGFPVR